MAGTQTKTFPSASGLPLVSRSKSCLPEAPLPTILSGLSFAWPRSDTAANMTQATIAGFEMVPAESGPAKVCAEVAELWWIRRHSGSSRL